MTRARKLTLLATGVLLATASTVQAADVGASCDTTSGAKTSLFARYTHTVQRATFHVALKAAQHNSLSPTSRITVQVDGVPVGLVKIAPSGDVTWTGSLAFDSFGDTGPAFPAGWPGVTADSVVTAGSLSCTLES